MIKMDRIINSLKSEFDEFFYIINNNSDTCKGCCSHEHVCVMRKNDKRYFKKYHDYVYHTGSGTRESEEIMFFVPAEADDTVKKDFNHITVDEPTIVLLEYNRLYDRCRRPSIMHHFNGKTEQIPFFNSYMVKKGNIPFIELDRVSQFKFQ